MTTGAPARTRFAPSPTGFVHIGSLRTVIFDWLWAKHTNGQFLLRIEDTDRKRYVEGAEEQLKDSLRTMGLQWDEGPDVDGPHAPYRQSERLEIYHKLANELLEKGYLYKCWCTPERLEQVNKEKQARKQPPGYDRHCRHLSPEERAAKEASGEPYTMRLAMPLEGETVLNDLIRGEVVFRNELQNDLVMIKSDGFPTYHFAAIVDDHLMNITHVLRGEEWIATSPIHVTLYKYFGWEQPVWVHVPSVLGPDGKKLSKRHGDTAINEYLDKGYLPEAIINFLALIGWGYDETTEIMTIDELIERFDITRISPSGGVFNIDKLNRFNGIYIRNMSVPELAERILPFLQKAELLPAEVTPEQRKRLEALVPLVQERMVVLSDAVDLLRSLFVAPESYDLKTLVPKRLDAETTRSVLEKAKQALTELPSWEVAALEERLRALVGEVGLKVGDVFMALRVATTGSTISPPLFETMHALDREEVLARLERALATFDSAA
jgi:glutamyl-tRNA synthetase, bacterial family